MKLRTYSVLLTLSIVLQFFPTTSPAQQPADPPAASVPPQLLSARTIFISNATGQGFAPAGVADLTYNEFYADMKAWGKYELVPRPGDADLILEIRYFQLPVKSGIVEAFSVVIREPRTQTILWSASEPIQPYARASTERKNFDHALAAIVASLKKITTST